MIEYVIRDDATTETIVKSKDGRIIEKSLKIFLEEDVNESLHEMLLQEVACCFSLKIHGMKNTCSTRDLLLKPSLRTRTDTLQRRLHPRRRNCGI